jgi:hypothetical protein
MADTPAENVFRVEGDKYIHNNVEISKEEFDKRKDEADAAIRANRPSSTKSKPRSVEDRKADAFSELKKGGAVKSASARADGIAIRGKTRA